jgi:hypothetical protein
MKFFWEIYLLDLKKNYYSAYKQFIDKAEIIKKGQENIRGMDTYHYLINTSKPDFKEFLNIFIDDLAPDLSSSSKENLNQIFGSIMVNSFDVWIGQKDNKIYQYNIVLDIPLSKIFGLADKSIGNNTMNISLKTTYFDFNLPNNISLFEESVPMIDFIKVININKLKNNVSNFRQLAGSFKEDEGSYGLKANINGSCLNPVSGSLFSPTGHKSSSVNIVGLISESLNSILDQTNNLVFCYSNSKDWSISVPILDDYDSAVMPLSEGQIYYCVDSAGKDIETNILPTTTSCPAQ